MTKALNRGLNNLIVLAIYIKPLEIILNLPLFWEEKNVPYVCESKQFYFSRACGVSKYYYSCYPISIRQLRKYRKKLNRFYYELINKNLGNFKKNNKMKFSFEKVFLVAVKINHSRTK